MGDSAGRAGDRPLIFLAVEPRTPQRHAARGSCYRSVVLMPLSAIDAESAEFAGSSARGTQLTAPRIPQLGCNSTVSVHCYSKQELIDVEVDAIRNAFINNSIYLTRYL